MTIVSEKIILYVILVRMKNILMQEKQEMYQFK